MWILPSCSQPRIVTVEPLGACLTALPRMLVRASISRRRSPRKVTSGATSWATVQSRSLDSIVTVSVAPATRSLRPMGSMVSLSSGSSSRESSARAFTIRTIISVLAVIPSMATVAVSGIGPSIPVESSWP